MGLSNLFKKAKGAVEDRGGNEALKEDANELRDIARGEGSLTDKAKEAATALKDPGAPGPEDGADTAAGRAADQAPGPNERPAGEAADRGPGQNERPAG